MAIFDATNSTEERRSLLVRVHSCYDTLIEAPLKMAKFRFLSPVLADAEQPVLEHFPLLASAQCFCVLNGQR